VVDLAHDQPASLLLGGDTGDYLNDLPLLTMGDVNGDGLRDLLVGARFGDGPGNSRTDAGEAYVILGRPDLPQRVDLAVPEADITIYGAAGQASGTRQGDQLGFSGAIADVSGDGRADIILGAPFVARPDNGAAAGAVYVIFGKAELPRVIDLASTRPDVTLLGATPTSYFGDSVAAGDVNGDGVDDLIIGAPFQPRPAGRERAGQLAGAAYVFFGGPGLFGERDTAKGEYHAVIFGEEEFEGGDELGDAVAAGDLDDDGIDDIVVTAEAADGPGNQRSVDAEVYVVYGRRDLAGELDIAARDQDVTIYGAEQNDTLGFNLAVADVTGDGRDDLLVTARGGDGPGNNTPEGGELHVFPGGSRLPETIDLAAYDDDAFLHGPDAADFLGNGIAAADFDGDGFNELVVGVPGGDGAADDSVNMRDAGEVYVVDARGLSGPAGVASLPVRLAVYGARMDDALGTSVAAGDMTGDGRPELAILALRSDGADGARPDAGLIYVLRP
jgi:hypothetical protein